MNQSLDLILRARRNKETYEGAKKMLLVDDVENREFLRELLDTMYPELTARKKR